MSDTDTVDQLAVPARDPESILSNLTEDELLALVETALDRLSVENLTAVGEAVQEKRRKKHDEARDALLKDLQARAASLGMRVNLVPMHAPVSSGSGRRTRSDAGGSLAPKFRGPNGETWTGRGRMPKWLAALEADGHNRNEFRIA